MVLPFIAASLAIPAARKIFGFKRGGSVSKALAQEAMGGIKIPRKRKARGGRMK